MKDKYFEEQFGNPFQYEAWVGKTPETECTHDKANFSFKTVEDAEKFLKLHKEMLDKIKKLSYALIKENDELFRKTYYDI